MVFGFMKQSGGHINVYSEQGVGTTFRLYLPRDTSNAAQTGRRSRPRTLRSWAALETILAVEDNAAAPRPRGPPAQRSLAIAASRPSDGPAALKMLEREKVDLLFTDVIMPGGMSGYDLGRGRGHALAQHQGAADLGLPRGKDQRQRRRRPGTCGCCIKPYRKEDLARTLREVIDE